MHAHSLALIGALFGAVITVSTARATPATTYQLSGDGVSWNTDITADITYSPPGGGGFTEDVWVGPVSLSVTNLVTQITTTQTLYCTDIFDDYQSGAIYTLGMLTDTLANPTKARQIAGLLANVTPLDAASGAAVQASIWEIENEPGTMGYNLNAGVFTISPDGITGDSAAYEEFITDAAAYLDNVSDGTWTAAADFAAAQYEVAPGSSPSQRFSFLTDPPVAAPEPASAALFASGLLGLVLLSRRGRQASVAADRVNAI